MAKRNDDVQEIAEEIDKLLSPDNLKKLPLRRKARAMAAATREAAQEFEASGQKRFVRSRANARRSWSRIIRKRSGMKKRASSDEWAVHMLVAARMEKTAWEVDSETKRGGKAYRVVTTNKRPSDESMRRLGWRYSPLLKKDGTPADGPNDYWEREELLQEKTAGTPFLEQDRPAKVKEIYAALVRDHPEMPAEVKARIASRKGKSNATSRKSPAQGGPAYKAPITHKRVGTGASAKYVGKTKAQRAKDAMYKEALSLSRDTPPFPRGPEVDAAISEWKQTADARTYKPGAPMRGDQYTSLRNYLASRGLDAQYAARKAQRAKDAMYKESQANPGINTPHACAGYFPAKLAEQAEGGLTPGQQLLKGTVAGALSGFGLAGAPTMVVYGLAGKESAKARTFGDAIKQEQAVLAAREGLQPRLVPEAAQEGLAEIGASRGRVAGLAGQQADTLRRVKALKSVAKKVLVGGGAAGLVGGGMYGYWRAKQKQEAAQAQAAGSPGMGPA